MAPLKEIFQKIHNTSVRIVSALEDGSYPFLYSVQAFCAATTLRNFLEQLVFNDSEIASLGIHLYHDYLSYVALAAAFILILRWATRESVERTARVVLPFFLVLCLTPLLDCLMFLKKGTYSLGYMFPGQHSGLLIRYFTFFGRFNSSGITPGMKVEIAVVLLACFSYLKVKGVSLGKRLLTCWAVYSMIFAYSCVPFFLQGVISLFGLKGGVTSEGLIGFYLVVITILSASIYHSACRSYCWELLKDIRPFRLLYFEIVFALGFAAFYVHGNGMTVYQFFSFVLTALAIAFGWKFSVMSNNLSDLQIDRVANPQRPTVLGTIPAGHYQAVMWGTLVWTLVLSASVSFLTLFFLALFIGNYILYSLPPLRLKRVPVLSKFAILINSVGLILLGIFAHGKDVAHRFLPLFFFILFPFCWQPTLLT